jgi:hypothetical protein
MPSGSVRSALYFALLTHGRPRNHLLRTILYAIFFALRIG